MSLINKMLKDLEARQGGARGDRPIFQDLQPVRSPGGGARGVVWLVLASVVIAGGGYAGWRYWRVESRVPLAAPVTVAAPVAVTVPVSNETAAPDTAVPAAPVPAVTEVAPPVVAGKPARIEPPAAKPVSKPRVAARKAPAAPPPRAEAKLDTTDDTTVRIEKVERPVTPQEQAAGAYREAVQWRGAGQAVEAERALRRALGHDPAHVPARQLLARLLVEGGRALEAQAVLEQGMAAAPGESGLRIQLARLHVEQGAEPRAVALLEGAGDVESQAFLAALYQRAGRHTEAIRAYESALAQRPQEGRWWIGLGISREAQQQDREASDAYRRALASGQLGAQLAGYAQGRLQALGK